MDWRYEMRFVHARADGVGPALLLSAPKGVAQYLFSVPEGFSRLVLEQRMRPSHHLSSIFLTSLHPQAAGGLGGLLLRLAQDGHGQVQVVGPKGVGLFLHALRHICRWRHPKVFVSECHSSRPLPIFDDDYTVIIPLVAGDESSRCPWCSCHSCLESESKDPRRKRKTVLSGFAGENVAGRFSVNPNNSCSSRGLDGSETSGLKVRKRSHDKSVWLSTENSSEKAVDTDRESRKTSKKVSPCQGLLLTTKQADSELPPDNCDGQLPCELDAFSTKHDCAEKIMKCRAMNWSEMALNCNAALPFIVDNMSQIDQKNLSNANSTMKKTFSFPSDSELVHSWDSLGLSASTESQPLYSMLDDLFVQHGCGKRSLKHKVIGTLTKAEKCINPLSVFNKMHGNVPVSVHAPKQINEEAKSAPHCMTSTHMDGTKQPYDSLPNEQSKGLISNIMEDSLPDLEDGSNPVFLKDFSSLSAIDSSKDKISLFANEHNNVPLLGYLCYLKKLHAGVLIIDCSTSESFKSIEDHQLLKCISSKVDLHKIVAIIHLTPISFQKLSSYKLWRRSFGENVWQFSTRGNNHEFGFISSLSTLLKLNTVNDQFFPLPFALKPIAGKKFQGSFDQKKKKKKRRLNQIVNIPIGVIVGKKESKIWTHFDESTHQRRSITFPTQDRALLTRSGYHHLLKKHADGLSADSDLTANRTAAVALRKELLLQKELLHEETNTFLPNQCLESPIMIRSSVDFAQNTNSSSKILSSMDVLIQENNLVDNRLIMEGVFPSPQKTHLSISDLRNGGFEVIFLGTGSAEPTKHRGSSGILLKIRGCNATMLLDAGEGVLGQLVRIYGKKGASEVLASLCCLWVSHKHADHVLGIYSVICARQGRDPLTVVGPSTVDNWISEVSKVSGDSFPLAAYRYIHSKEFCILGASMQSSLPSGREYEIGKMLEQLQLRNMKSVSVDHCYEAYGLVLFSNDGWSIVYSGDTRPCKQLIQAGIGCTLLIHEATFEDNLYSHAIRKRHSTVTEALDSALQMSAQNVILTHFSQRYPKIVNIKDAQDLSVFVAFDGMVISSDDLKSFDSLLPILSLVLEDKNSPNCDSNIQPVKGNNLHGSLLTELNPPNNSAQALESTMQASVVLDQAEGKSGMHEITDFIGISTKNEVIQNLHRSRASTHIRWEDSDSD